MLEISICICTYRRPKGLRRLLESIEHLSDETPPFEVIVVDNDERRSAESIVSDFASREFTIHYSIEPVRNIARARNRSVEAATGRYVAFIDDDEEAQPQWLTALWGHIRESNVQGVFGPVIPQFESVVPPWIVAGKFFDRQRYQTGAEIPWNHLRTGNALIERASLESIPGPFDESFGLTGGEDTALFRHMTEYGARFLAVDEAMVFEYVSSSRTNLRWLVSRNFRIGCCLARLELSKSPLNRRIWFILLTFCDIAARTALAGVLLPVFRIAGVRLGVLPASRAIGKVAQFAGYTLKEYARPIAGWNE